MQSRVHWNVQSPQHSRFSTRAVCAFECRMRPNRCNLPPPFEPLGFGKIQLCTHQSMTSQHVTMAQIVSGPSRWPGGAFHAAQLHLSWLCQSGALWHVARSPCREEDLEDLLASATQPVGRMLDHSWPQPSGFPALESTTFSFHRASLPPAFHQPRVLYSEILIFGFWTGFRGWLLGFLGIAIS